MNTTTEQRSTPAMVGEVITLIQNRNYGAAEAKASTLLGRLMTEEAQQIDQRLTKRREAAHQSIFANRIVLHGEDETVIAEMTDLIRALPNGTPLTIRVQKSSDEADLAQLLRLREGAVGITLKQLNRKITTLQIRIDNQKRRTIDHIEEEV